MENPPLLDRILIWLHPPLKIFNPKWRMMWQQKDKNLFRKTATTIWVIFSIVYLAHFILVDLPLHKTPIQLWAKYRFGLGILGLGCSLLLNLKSFQKLSFYRLPALITGIFFSYFQAQSMIWRKEVPYAYAIVIAVLSTLSISTSMAFSLVYLSLIYLLQSKAWLSRGDELPYIISAATVGYITVTVFRARLSIDVDFFISEQSRLETQTLLIQKQEEMNEQVKAFLPKKVYKKLLSLILEEKISVAQAIDEVMRPRYTFASCIYSDIRGFTQLIKKDRKYILSSVLPSQKTFNDIVQEYNGISRNTGDLVFAFFENDRNIISTLTEALTCAVEVIKKQKLLNQENKSDRSIKRYVSLSFGVAIVGNTGGIDGGRDMAVFGDCANILSRIDELTKNESLGQFITTSTIILSQEAGAILKQIFPFLKIEEVVLKNYHLSLRDFSDNSSVYLLNSEEVSLLRILNTSIEPTLQEKILKQYEEEPEAQTRAA